MSLIVGIDVGIKNLSICVLDKNQVQTPVCWVLLDIRGKTPVDVIRNLLDELNELDLCAKYDISKAFVELQMHKRLVGISYALLTYFSMYSVDVQLINAAAKKKYLNATEQYSDRKLSAIEAVSARICPSSRNMLDNHKKKDDLCDSYLYALHGCEKLSQARNK